ncbi:PREDICTED: uncharacterized protein LOC104601818 [Nelumbo nucifera]|uniref:Uncharacterized protein n=2 Tax=Nelumbo nucifera TaxID=4432 RepID=A0A822XR67_NELNU|nr:PREDICTED: uncharacterized protein LOC104601818 [Nelumbo nucifera]DAD21599.1 TPA_asm: hypothetical protein HUJ06_023062 [Nelumbo nucifera]
MDSFDFDNIKAEKANAMLRYRRIRKIANLFRFLEACLALIIVSWFSARLPVAIKTSGEYFQKLCVVLVSPLFVFLLGNAIIITLFIKSDQFSGQTATASNSSHDIYDEFVKNSENRQKIRPESPEPSPEVIVYEDKETVSEGSTAARTYQDVQMISSTKTYRRIQSEKFTHESREKLHRELRRSETEKCQKVNSPDPDEKGEVTSYAEPMSNEDAEEFRRKIEAFIAKQQKFQREESMAIILQSLIS